MDLIESLMKKLGYVKEEKVVEKKEQPKPRKDLGVCVPLHAQKKGKDSKKIKFVIKNDDDEDSPFDKLRKEYEKDKAEFNKAVKHIMEQQPSEPYDYDPELGIEHIAEEGETNSPLVKSLTAKSTKEKESTEKSDDELDEASNKMEGYVPRFSASARKKLGLEQKSTESSSKSYAQFEVDGVYVGVETMISGVVIRGKLTKRMSGQIGKNNIRISDLKQKLSSVSEINEGEEGTIFTRGSLGLIKNGDIIEFS